jgi:hypothetical protein
MGLCPKPQGFIRRGNKECLFFCLKRERLTRLLGKPFVLYSYWQFTSGELPLGRAQFLLNCKANIGNFFNKTTCLQIILNLFLSYEASTNNRKISLSNKY